MHAHVNPLPSTTVYIYSARMCKTGLRASSGAQRASDECTVVLIKPSRVARTRHEAGRQSIISVMVKWRFNYIAKTSGYASGSGEH